MFPAFCPPFFEQPGKQEMKKLKKLLRSLEPGATAVASLTPEALARLADTLADRIAERIIARLQEAEGGSAPPRGPSTE